MNTNYMTGVVSANSVPAIWDDAFYGDYVISDYDIAVKEGSIDPNAEDYEYYEIEDCTYYIGFRWTSDGDEIVPAEGVEFSAVLQALGGAYNVHVVQSKHTTSVASMCSPCCPGQADLDSGLGNNWDCYTLPPEYFEDTL
jgi:hypothetical protein